MKQFIKIALLVFYVFFNAGLSYSIHFCGDEFQRINLFAESKTCCPSQEPVPGCCDDVSNLEFPNTDQHQVEALEFSVLDFDRLGAVTGRTEPQFSALYEEKVVGFSDSSPPFLQNTPIYIFKQVFLI